MLFDLHTHSTISPCSDLRLEEIIAHAGKRGLDGVCITDHQSMAAGKYIREGIQDNGICLLVGMEYETPDGDFLVFGPFEDLIPGLSARELLTTVRSTGGAAIAAHPFRAGRPVREYVVRENLCQVVESVNGRNTEVENRQLDAWRGQYVFSECCGSDAHSLDELGKLKTRFDLPILSRADLVLALNNGLFSPDATIN